MIEINLLPGGKKKTRQGTGGGVDFKAIAAGIASRVKDPYLAGAVATYIVSIGAVAWLWTSQGARSTELDERLAKATTDSTMYAKVIAEQEDFIRRNIAGQKTKQAKGRRRLLSRLTRSPTTGCYHRLSASW